MKTDSASSTTGMVPPLDAASVAAAPPTVHLKVQLGSKGGFRRLAVPTSQLSTLRDLRLVLRSLVDAQAAASAAATTAAVDDAPAAPVYWRDDDGDLVLIANDAELAEAVRVVTTCIDPPVMRLFVRPRLLLASGASEKQAADVKADKTMKADKKKMKNEKHAKKDSINNKKKPAKKADTSSDSSSSDSSSASSSDEAEAEEQPVFQHTPMGAEPQPEQPQQPAANERVARLLLDMEQRRIALQTARQALKAAREAALGAGVRPRFMRAAAAISSDGEEAEQQQPQDVSSKEQDEAVKKLNETQREQLARWQRAKDAAVAAHDAVMALRGELQAARQQAKVEHKAKVAALRERRLAGAKARVASAAAAAAASTGDAAPHEEAAVAATGKDKIKNKTPEEDAAKKAARKAMREAFKAEREAEREAFKEQRRATRRSLKAAAEADEAVQSE